MTHTLHVFKISRDDLNLRSFAIIEKRTEKKFSRKTRLKLHTHNNWARVLLRVHGYKIKNFSDPKNKFAAYEKARLILFTFSSWMRRYWFYVKNDFRNFHQIFMFWDPLSQKKGFLRKCLSVCLSVVGRVRHNSR